MKRIATAIVWIITGPIIAYGAILGVATLFAKAFGGPLEPPPNLTWSEFKEYRDSGRWFIDSMSISVACILMPSLILFWASRRGNKKRNELGDVHSPSAHRPVGADVGAESRTMRSVAKILSLITAVIVVSGCSNNVRTEFPSIEAAKAAKAFDRGWLPPILPDGTTQIVEENDVELNFGQGSFHFPSKSVEAYLETMRTIYGASIATDNTEVRIQIKTASSYWTVELNRQRGRGKYTVKLER